MATTPRLTNKEIKDFVVDVVKETLTQAGYTEETMPKIITSHQNAPAPAFPYITVSYAGPMTRVGRATVGDINPTTGKRYIIQDNEVTMTITEEGGDGTYLSIIRDYLETMAVQELFQTNGIALIRQPGSINPSPELFNESWERGSQFEIYLGVASGLIETVGYIEDVEMASGNQE